MNDNFYVDNGIMRRIALQKFRLEVIQNGGIKLRKFKKFKAQPIVYIYKLPPWLPGNYSYFSVPKTQAKIKIAKQQLIAYMRKKLWRC